MRLGKFPSATGDLRTDAVRELRWAMAGEGLTPDKLRVMEAVLELPVVADAIAGVPDSRRPTVAYGVVADAARALGASLPQQVLRTALAIDYEGQARNLTERRALYTSFRDAHTLYYIEQRMLEALVTALGGLSGVRRGSRPAPTAPTAATTAPGPRAWNVPLLRDPHFLGRDALLDAIHTELATSRTTALSHTITHTVSGLGGIGKTALAAEFAYRFASEYDVVWWVRSEEPTTLAGDYAALATPLGIAPGASQADTVRAVREWLQAHDRWLLVFDNAEHDEDIAALLPGLRGNVLVTSRSSQWTTVATVVDVPPLDERSAAELVLRRTGTSDLDAAARLARKLDGIPKLIDVAAGIFVRGAGVSLTRFANQLDDGAAATQGVWDAAFDRAVAAPGARAVLAACTALNPDDVSDQLLVHLTGLPDGTVDAAIGALRSQQILRAAADGLMLHRLVQRAVRDRLDTDERAAAARRASDLLLAANPVPEPAGFAAIRRLQTHAPYVAAALGDDERVAPLLTWYAECLRRDGAYPAARRIAEQAVANAESAAGDGALAAALGIQAVVLRDMGQLDAAHAVAERAVKLSETVHGPDHTDVAEQLHVLATIRCDLGDMHGARDAAARAVAIVSAARGPEHPDVGRPLEVLAWILRELGDLPHAREAAERALAITETALGPEHLDVTWRLDALAVILRGLGELQRAREAEERALAITQSVLGPDHRAVGSQLGVLARILRGLGEHAAARAAAERAVQITRAAHGTDHPVVAVQLGNLALVLADCGDLTGARDAIEAALRSSRTTLGEEHRDVGWQLGVLARILGQLGELPAARDAAARSLAIGRATLDPEHPVLAARVQLLDDLVAKRHRHRPAS